MMIVVVAFLGQAASHTIDPPAYEPPGLAFPALILAIILALIIGITALIRTRRSQDERE